MVVVIILHSFVCERWVLSQRALNRIAEAEEDILFRLLSVDSHQVPGVFGLSLLKEPLVLSDHLAQLLERARDQQLLHLFGCLGDLLRSEKLA